MISTSRPRSSTVAAAAAWLAVASFAGAAAAADTIVQVPVDSVLDGRTVSTAAGQTITSWVTGQGIDGDGNGDGYVTNAVETLLVAMGKAAGGKANPALPDDGHFAANARHPEVVLHFSNAAPPTSLQTRQMYITKGAQMFQFDVPNATYSKMFVFITASEGAANLTITLNYSGGAAASSKQYHLPDYGIGGAGANDPVFFNLIQGLRKWNASNTENDGTSHTITAIEIAPTPTATLTSIKVEKMGGSHCVFWGATGIATSAVTTGAGGSGGTAGAGGSSDGGAAGATATDAGTTTDGAAGAGGVGGSTTTGTAGGSAGTGAAGSTTTGTAGTGSTTTGTAGTGAAGSATTGAAGTGGTSTGAAGTAPPRHASSGGGCSLAGASPRDAAWLVLAAALAAVIRRRRRR